ncbi:MAG: hypothetical protein EPN62_19900 [Candidimonas sp.]|nr:MAG: hypothetical protein EPN62_19900 [Candidimonas sp.]
MGTGGSRYGAGRPGYHHKTFHFHSIDVRRLQRENNLRAGLCLTCAWKDDSGKVLSSIGMTVDQKGVTFNYRINDQPVNQYVILVKTACNYGGSRTWFLCPYCQRRCTHVYFGQQVACRKCHRLRYPSQSDDDTGATWRKQRKLEARLGGENYWRKPKGMHEATFQRIRQEIIGLESERDRLLCISYTALMARLNRIQRHW